MYPVNSGYAITQGPGGVSVACQLELSGGPHEGQPQALHGMMTSGYQPERVDMPHMKRDST